MAAKPPYAGFPSGNTRWRLKRRSATSRKPTRYTRTCTSANTSDFIADIHHLAGKRQRIETVITLVGLTAESKKKLGQLSKGYKQRVGLAAALLHEPEVLILDEPTSGLDPNQIIEIREVIRKLGKDKTILFSSHILQEVEALCDRVIIINKGKLVADSPLSQLRAQNAATQYDPRRLPRNTRDTRNTR